MRRLRAQIAVLSLSVAACGSAGHRAALPDSGTGLPDVVFTMSGHVNPGSEELDCLYVRMPTDRWQIAAPGAESHFTPGSHHFLAYRTQYPSIPVGGDTVHPCADGEQTTGITGSYFEAQQPDSRRDLPPGVAHVFAPGEVLLLTAHYENPSATAFDTHVEFRIHTMDLAAVQHVAGSLFFNNVLINVPPMSTVTATQTCPIDRDIQLALLWSHMHSRGVAFKATTDDPAASAQAGVLYETTTWNEPTPRTFPDAPPVTVHEGSTITFSCTYDNPTPQTFVQGPSASANEMCLLHGMYWPRMSEATETCLEGVEQNVDGGKD